MVYLKPAVPNRSQWEIADGIDPRVDGKRRVDAVVTYCHFHQA